MTGEPVTLKDLRVWWCETHKAQGPNAKVENADGVEVEVPQVAQGECWPTIFGESDMSLGFCDMTEALLIVKQPGRWPESVALIIEAADNTNGHYVLDALAASISGDTDPKALRRMSLCVHVSQQEADAADFAGPLATYDGWVRPVSVADLVSALRAEGVLVAEETYGCHRCDVDAPTPHEPHEPDHYISSRRFVTDYEYGVLDALAEAQQ